MITLSVVTINYNNAEGLLKTIESVVEQEFSAYEYIVVDGGSTDGSKEIIERYSDKITYWVSEPDNGLYYAMNKGIGVSKGKYIHFLNSGDYYASKDILSTVFSREYTEPFVRGVQLCDYGDSQIRWTNLGNRDVTLYDMYVNTMLHEATIIRRDMFGKYGLYDENLKIVSDWKFFLQAILGGERTAFVDKELIVFEMNGVSTNKSHGEKHLQERKAVLQELMPNNMITDYERLKQLEADSYIPRLIKSNKMYLFLFKIMNKLSKIFR